MSLSASSLCVLTTSSWLCTPEFAKIRVGPIHTDRPKRTVALNVTHVRTAPVTRLWSENLCHLQIFIASSAKPDPLRFCKHHWRSCWQSGWRMPQTSVPLAEKKRGWHRGAVSIAARSDAQTRRPRPLAKVDRRSCSFRNLHLCFLAGRPKPQLPNRSIVALRFRFHFPYLERRR